MSRRFTIWQCTDFCCEDRPFSSKWWNVGTAPGRYTSRPSWQAALAVAYARKLPWRLA